MERVRITRFERRSFYQGFSTDEKPLHGAAGDLLYELDTGKIFVWADAWIEEQRNRSKMLLWNTETLAWEASTKGSGVGQDVSVENFPTVISGVEVPISDAKADPLSEYKIADIDPTEGNSYFGYTSKNGKWYIMKLTAAAARYIKGDSGYVTAWGNKGVLNYDYFYNIF